MDKEKKKNTTLKIIIVVAIVIIIIVGVYIIISNNSKENTNTNITIVKNNTYNTDIEQIKNKFNESEIKIDYNTDSSVYTCKTSKEAIDSMMKSLTKNKIIDNKWDTDVSTYYQEQNNVVNADSYEMSLKNVHIIALEYDLNDVTTDKEAKKVLKDFSKIIWESLNIIYNNPNIDSENNKYFENIRYQVFLKKNSTTYMDKYGNPKTEYHSKSLTFYISKNSFNQINKVTFPSILDNDYFKIFNLGKLYNSSSAISSEDRLILYMLDKTMF